MSKKKITELVSELLEGYLKEEGMSLYYVEYVKEGPNQVLRAYIDKDDYVGTDDCEKVSKYLSEKLDEVDPIEKNYMLEVSSPGLDRVLVTKEHFDRYMGELIEVSLYKEVDGTKKLVGNLLSHDENGIELGLQDKELNILFNDIAKVNLAVVF